MDLQKKTHMEGNLITYKAKLIAKGYCQRQGLDCDETVSMLAMLKSKRILLGIATHYDYEIWQMDVKTNFRKGNPSKDVCMTQPEVFTHRNDNKGYKIQTSIYGLKQASRSWNIRFNEIIKEFDSSKNADEPCVYKKDSGSAIVFLMLYVDDRLLNGNNVPMLQLVSIFVTPQNIP